jgi:hypothetical protein
MNYRCAVAAAQRQVITVNNPPVQRHRKFQLEQRTMSGGPKPRRRYKHAHVDAGSRESNAKPLLASSRFDECIVLLKDSYQRAREGGWEGESKNEHRVHTRTQAQSITLPVGNLALPSAILPSLFSLISHSRLVEVGEKGARRYKEWRLMDKRLGRTSERARELELTG